jgi:hypothetical protein
MRASSIQNRRDLIQMDASIDVLSVSQNRVFAVEKRLGAFVERSSGFVERSADSNERSRGLVERSTAANERSAGPVERSRGPVERSTGVNERSLTFAERSAKAGECSRGIGERSAATGSDPLDRATDYAAHEDVTASLPPSASPAPLWRSRIGIAASMPAAPPPPFAAVSMLPGRRGAAQDSISPPRIGSAERPPASDAAAAAKPLSPSTYAAKLTRSPGMLSGSAGQYNQ